MKMAEHGGPVVGPATHVIGPDLFRIVETAPFRTRQAEEKMHLADPPMIGLGVDQTTQPRFDAVDFAGTLVASLQGLGTSADNIGVLASVAVPDTLKLDASQPSSFPNGRAPADDVIDVLLGLILNSPGIGDGVDGNDRPFEAEFPFLASPQQAP